MSLIGTTLRLTWLQRSHSSHSRTRNKNLNAGLGAKIQKVSLWNQGLELVTELRYLDSVSGSGLAVWSETLDIGAQG